MEAYKLNVEEESDIKPQTTLFTSSDGTELYSASWIPQGMKVLIIMVHGLGEHIIRFNHWAHLFYENKIGFTGFDLRGHGHNKGIRGKMDYNVCLKDMDAFIMNTHERFPFVPKILYGHSMGGNLVMRYTIEYKPKLAGVISTSPWLKLVKMPSPQLVNLIKLIGKIFPFLTVSNGLNSSDLSRDTSACKAYDDDPLVHHRISPDLFLKITESGNFILLNRHKINLPILLMHGTGDNITSCKASTDFANFTGEFTTLRLWKNSYHELHHELDRTDIFRFILQWIEQLPALQ